MMVFLLRITICWGFFALLYALLLGRETFFRANRIYLMATLIGSILIAAFSEFWSIYAQNDLIPTVVMPEIVIGYQRVEALSNHMEGYQYLLWIYIVGVVGGLSRLVFGLARLWRIARSGEAEKLDDGTILVRSSMVNTPFSFGKWIFLPEAGRQLAPDQYTYILAHEKAHVRGQHSIDVIILELVCALCWFHPLAFWYRNTTRNVHEYLADAAATRQHSVKQYGLC